MVVVAPIFEREDTGHYYNTAAVIDADGTYLGNYRKTHIPQVEGFWEKFYFRPGNLGYPIFDTAVGRIGVYICFRRVGENSAWPVPESYSTRLPRPVVTQSICGNSNSRQQRWRMSTS